MATATVKGYLTIREIIKNDSVQISGNTFMEVIENLVLAYPKLKNEILNEDTSLKRDYVFLLNGRNIEFANKEQTLIKEGDKISIFPPIGDG
jgi:molybdopterin synthase sulfur carrier subunit